MPPPYVLPPQFNVLIGIMACDPKGSIGKEGKIPWSYPEETAYFRKTVENEVLIMGRTTYECLPPSLRKRQNLNIVFSTNQSLTPEENTRFVSSLDEFLRLKIARGYMIGGALLARLFLSHGLLGEFLLTKIKKEYPGDAFFPLELLSTWTPILIRETDNFTINLLHNLSACPCACPCPCPKN